MFLFSVTTAAEQHRTKMAELQISEKITPPNELKPNPIKKSLLARDKLDQFVVGVGNGSGNASSITFSTELNVGSSDVMLQTTKNSIAVFQRVRNM